MFVKRGYVLINIMAVLIVITLISTFVFKIVNNDKSSHSLINNYKYEDLYGEPYLEDILCKVNGYFKDKKELLMDKSTREYGVEFLDMSLDYDRDKDKFVLVYMKNGIREDEVYLRYKEVDNRIILIPDKEIYNLE